jgi:lipopolysaccharide transport system ATP-binding protein
VTLTAAAAVQFKNVSKKYRRPSGRGLSTTLKSFLLRDAWRRRPAAGAKADEAVWVLRGVNMQIHRGRTTGIVGRNGAGKSTLLKLVGGILGPDAGEVIINGRVAALIELGAGFHPELSGRENILINGVILGQSKAEMRASTAAIIAFADLAEYIDYPVRTYSSGMYARLGFAVAIHVDPDILLIDEILSVGDAEFTQKCQLALDGFKARGKSIVVVSHDLNTIRTWCDDALWLDGGRIAMQGTAAEVVAAYETATQAPKV